MVLALACPVTLPLVRSVSPGPESNTTSDSETVESVLEAEVLKQSSHRNGRIMFFLSAVIVP